MIRGWVRASTMVELGEGSPETTGMKPYLLCERTLWFFVGMSDFALRKSTAKDVQAVKMTCCYGTIPERKQEGWW